MSYPAIFPTLSSFSPVSSPSPGSRGLAAFSPRSGLLAWLRLATRDFLPADETLHLDSYSACEGCRVESAASPGRRWCGEGIADERPLDLPFEFASGRTFDPSGAEDASRLLGSQHAQRTLVLGAQADPYPRVEAAQERTRGLLRLLAGHAVASEGRDAADAASTTATPAAPIADSAISILTRSSLALRDLDLLVDLDQRHVLTVGVLLPTTDPRLLRRLEPRVPSASFAASAIDDRLHLAATLAAHGIATRILCSPIVAGVNNSAGSLHGLFEAALAAGASDVLPAPLHPNLQPTSAESGQLLALFYRLRLQYGFPRILPGRA